MKEIIGGIIFWSYILFVPWRFKKKITLYLLATGVVSIIVGIASGKSDFFGIGAALIVLHFVTIFTSRGAWADSKGIDGYNTSKRLIAGECPYCNKRISRTAKVCPHCTTELF